MKRSIIIITIFMVCLMLSNSKHSLAGPSGGVIIAPKFGGKINIDGELEEWQLQLFSDDNKIVLTKKNGFINTGTIDNDNDFSAIVYALYDDDNLYLAAEVTDDAIDKGNAGGNNWQNDCIEIWIDGANDAGTMTDRGGNDPDNYQLNVDVKGEPWVYRNDDAQNILKQISASAKVVGTNYTLEVLIPFAAIEELDLKKGSIGFSISFVDSDKSVWNHILWQGEIEHEPSQWGDLNLSSKALAVNLSDKLSITWGRLKRTGQVCETCLGEFGFSSRNQ